MAGDSCSTTLLIRALIERGQREAFTLAPPYLLNAISLSLFLSDSHTLSRSVSRLAEAVTAVRHPSFPLPDSREGVEREKEKERVGEGERCEG